MATLVTVICVATLVLFAVGDAIETHGKHWN